MSKTGDTQDLQVVVAKIRRWMNHNSRFMLIGSFLTLLVAVPLSIALDLLLPAVGFGWLTLRALTVAVIVPAIVLPVSYVVMKEDTVNHQSFEDVNFDDDNTVVENNISFKDKFSPFWRLRFGLAFIAVVVLVSLALGRIPGVYPLVSAIVLSAVVGAVLFIMKTPEELRLEALGVPDYRDTLIFDAMSEAKQKALAKRKKNREKIDKINWAKKILNAGKTNSDTSEKQE